MTGMSQSSTSRSRRRELDLPDLDAVLIEARRLYEGGYEKAGKWDLTQICRHVAPIMHAYIDGMNFKVPWFIRLIGPWLIKPRLFRTRRIRAGIPLPQEVIPRPATSKQDERAAVEELGAAIDRLKRHKGAFERSPFLGPLTREQVLDFHTIHTMHHLSFLIPRP